MSGNALRRGAHVAMRAAMKDGARGASMTPRGIAAPVIGGWSAASEGCVDATTARARARCGRMEGISPRGFLRFSCAETVARRRERTNPGMRSGLGRARSKEFRVRYID